MGSKIPGRKHPASKPSQPPKVKRDSSFISKQGTVEKGVSTKMRIYYPKGTKDKNYVTNDSMEKARETYKKRGISTRKLGRKSKI